MMIPAKSNSPIFIFVFHLGVKGAALATVLSQAVGAIWILRFLSGKKTILHLRKENFKLQKEILLPCLALGISTFVMLSTESILSISFTSSLSRYGGDLAVGAMTIITSVSQLATHQVNTGNFLQSNQKLLKPGTYSFDLNINNLTYEFEFNVSEDENNGDVENKIARLINRSNIGLSLIHI